MPLNQIEAAAQKTDKTPLDIIWPIVFVGALLGLVLSWSVLSGDASGRVNLLYLILVYLFIPIISVVTSLLSAMFSKGINLAHLLSKLSLTYFKGSHRYQVLLRKIHQCRLDKYWFLMQSQVAAIAFTLTSLWVFFALLLMTDINFVWRSTILSASDVSSVLEFIARPWWFWSGAQPSLELLEMTQDSRLVSSNVGANIYASWWQFILATQIVYSLLLRSILLLCTHLIVSRKLNADLAVKLQSRIDSHRPHNQETHNLCPVTHQIPHGITVNNWGGAPEELLKLIPEIDLNDDNLILAGPRATQSQQLIAERWQGQQLVIVKAWEPPLAELDDFLQMGQGYLLPLEWDNQIEQSRQAGLGEILTPSSETHLSEWHRLVNRHSQWQLYLPIQLKQTNKAVSLGETS